MVYMKLKDTIIFNIKVNKIRENTYNGKFWI